MIQEYSYLEGHYSTKHCQDRWKLSKAFGLCHSKSRDGLSLDKYSSNALTGHNAGFSVFSYILPSSEESNGSSFCLWFLRSPVLVDVFSSCSVNTDWKRLFLVKAKVLSPSANKVKHDAEPNEVLRRLWVWRWRIIWRRDFCQVVCQYSFMMFNFGEPCRRLSSTTTASKTWFWLFKKWVGNDVEFSFQLKKSL